MSGIKNQTNLNNITEVQKLSTLDPLFEKISDDNSAAITGGATRNFNGRLPRIGSKTFPAVYTTTTEFNDITIRLLKKVPHELTVKAVRADGSGDVSSAPRIIPANYEGLITVAAGVRDNTPFKLNFNATTLASFPIEGRITY